MLFFIAVKLHSHFFLKTEKISVFFKSEALKNLPQQPAFPAAVCYVYSCEKTGAVRRFHGTRLPAT
jgi:hypothetical protein